MLVRFGDGHQQPVVEGAAEHRRGPQHVDVLRVEPAETKQHGLADRLGELEGVGPRDLAAVVRLAQHLLEHERVPLGAGMDRGGELGADVVRAQDRGDHLLGLRERQRLDRDSLGQTAPPPGLDGAREGVGAVELVAPVGGEQHHAAPCESTRGVLEQLAGRAVGPVEVVEDEQLGARVRPEVEQRDEGLEEPQLRLGRVAGRGGGAVAELREDLRELRDHRSELGAQSARVLLVQPLADRLDEGEIGQRELGL